MSNQPTREERFVGCLLGGAIGDALGAPIEFRSIDSIREEHGPSGVTGFPVLPPLAPITDDTQMTLFTAEGVVLGTREGVGLVAAVDAAYQRWLATQNARPLAGVNQEGWLLDRSFLYARRAPGTTCLSALARPERGSVEHRINNSKGCGGVMRVAPIGLVGGEDSFELAVEVAALTHGHPTGYLSAGAFAQIVAALVAGESLRDAAEQACDTLTGWDDHEETLGAIRAALTLAERGDAPCAETVAILGEGWVAEEALSIALYCALTYPNDPRRALLLAVNHSGDSDSTGAICGNLIGTERGVTALPNDWLARVEGRAEVEHTAIELATEGYDPFDYEFWESDPEPIDVLSCPSGIPGEPWHIRVYRNGCYYIACDTEGNITELGRYDSDAAAVQRATEYCLPVDLETADADTVWSVYHLDFARRYDHEGEYTWLLCPEPDAGVWNVRGVSPSGTVAIAAECVRTGFGEKWEWNVTGCTEIIIDAPWATEPLRYEVPPTDA